MSTIVPAGRKLILASQSPRRRELLARAGFAFSVRLSGIEEIHRPGETAEGYVCRLAREKAEAVAMAPDEVILGADTTVVAAGEILEKPLDAGDAARMLRLLSGRAHEVITGVCLRSPQAVRVAAECTRVHFLDLSEEEIAAYVATGEPMDKAGAYAIQGYASKFIHRVEGCHFNVVGLPVALVYRLWKEITAIPAASPAPFKSES